MTALSIREMRFALREREVTQAQQDAVWYASLSDAEKANRSHYWHVERKAKRGQKWIHVTELFATKQRAAEYWNKNFRGRAGFRLRHLHSY